MAKTKFTIGVDLGGTKILVAVVDDKGQVVGTAKKTTHADKGPKEVVGRILQTMDEGGGCGQAVQARHQWYWFGGTRRSR